MTATTVAFEPLSAERWREPFSMYRELREHDPVHHVVDGDYWVLSRFEDVYDAARDTATFSSAQGLTFTYDEREKMGIDFAPIVMMDPPEHTDFRRLVGKGFTPRRVSEIEPAIRDFVAGRLDRLVDAGGGDIVAELFKPLPSFVVAHYLGVPDADRERFDAWTDAIVAHNAAGDIFAAQEAIGELIEYFTYLIELRKAEPADDMTSLLVEAAEEGDTDVLAILGFAFTMVTGGNDTTTGLLGGSAELLTRNPSQRRRLLDDPALLPNAVEELLRLTSPVQGLARTTTLDVTIGDETIPAGRKVLLLYAAANRDAREFGPDAEELDIGREIDRIMSFTYGAHHCLGAAAARLQGRVALGELLARCPNFAVDHEAGKFAPGHYVRRYENLPFVAEAS